MVVVITISALYSISCKEQKFITDSTISNSFTFKDSINEYHIASKQKAIKSTTIFQKEMNLLIKELEMSYKDGYGGELLSFVENKYSINELRETYMDSETIYYCVYSNKDNSNRLYVFFHKLNEWSSFGYVLLNMNNKGYDVQKGDDLLCYINALDF